MKAESDGQSLPTGMVTFLVTDVVASTNMWQQHPDAMAAALAAHETILRRELTADGGYEFGTAGDSFAVAFSSAVSAVRSATNAQQALAAHPWGAVRIRVRIGLHTGPTEERDGRYFGVAVNKAARIEALADADQVLLSEATRSLVGHEMSDDLTFRDLGKQRLKSFEQPEKLFQVVADGLACNAPDQTTRADSRLPYPATRFIGRASAVARLAGAISPGQLISVTGLGGLGKTRLSIEAARAAGPRFPDGTWWVDLTPLSQEDSLALHAAAELGITPQGQKTAIGNLVGGLRGREAVIVFDNCEHVIDKAAELISTLRSECPNLGLVATSREPLGLRGEEIWPLATMSAHTDGVELLVDRAQSRDGSFDPQDWPAEDLIDLCQRLDGLPLAIEMAAARLRTLSPRQIIERLDDRFRMLRQRDRDVPARHQTLLAALDWSYEQLDPDEGLLLDRLSAFAGSFDLAAVQHVCGDDRLDEFDILDLLSSLLDKSLVSRVSAEVSSRYRMLETVRHYCSTHLDEAATTHPETGAPFVFRCCCDRCGALVVRKRPSVLRPLLPDVHRRMGQSTRGCSVGNRIRRRTRM